MTAEHTSPNAAPTRGGASPQVLSSASPALLCAASVFVATYAICQAVGWTAFVYLPEQRAWSASAPDNTLAMTYFAHVAQAGGAALVTALVGMVAPVQRVLVAHTAWIGRVTVTLYVLALGYFAISELIAV